MVSLELQPHDGRIPCPYEQKSLIFFLLPTVIYNVDIIVNKICFCEEKQGSPNVQDRSIPCLSQKSWNKHTLAGCTSPLSSYNGEPPHRRPDYILFSSVAILGADRESMLLWSLPSIGSKEYFVLWILSNTWKNWKHNSFDSKLLFMDCLIEKWSAVGYVLSIHFFD